MLKSENNWYILNKIPVLSVFIINLTIYLPHGGGESKYSVYITSDKRTMKNVGESSMTFYST